MHRPVQILNEFVLERVAEVPLHRRITILRALAALLPAKSTKSRALLAMADELQAIEERHQQLLLDFKRRMRP